MATYGVVGVRVWLAAGLLVLWAVPARPACQDPLPPECSSAVACGPSMDGHFEANFLGRTFDGTNTTFSYRVCEILSSPDLSHWVIGLTCLDRLVGYSPISGAEPTPNGDPTTCVPGLKWNTGGGVADCSGTCGGQGGGFSFTLSGNVPETMIPAGVIVGTKAGQLTDIFCIQGPDCDALPPTSTSTSTSTTLEESTTSTTASIEETTTTSIAGETTTTSTAPQETTSTTTSTPTSTTLGCGLQQEICYNEVDDDCDTLVDCVDEEDCAPEQEPCRILRDPSLIRFNTNAPGRDLFTSRGRVLLREPVDLASQEIGWFVSNSDGYIFQGALIAGDLIVSRPGRGTFADRAAAQGRGRRFGIFTARVKVRNGVAYYAVKAFGDLSAATGPEMTVQFYIGHQVWGLTGTWRQLPNGWKLPHAVLE
jgi:hypothetical protein